MPTAIDSNAMTKTIIISNKQMDEKLNTYYIWIFDNGFLKNEPFTY
jgi:hypothetical protein